MADRTEPDAVSGAGPGGGPDGHVETDLGSRGGIEPGAPLAVALHPGHGLGLASAGVGSAGLASAGVGSAGLVSVRRWGLANVDPTLVVHRLNRSHQPRWVWWDRATAAELVAAGVEVDRCWDVLVVHRLLVGGWRTSVPEAWAWLNGLDVDSLPTMGQLDLLTSAPRDGGEGAEGGDPENPIRPDGHLRPEWLTGGWHGSTDRLARWAELALRASTLQLDRLAERPDPARSRSTAHAESMAELLCAELAYHGLPVDEGEAAGIIGEFAGPRPADRAEEAATMAGRDQEVLRHLEPPAGVNLRNPAEVKAMLGRNGVDLPDTRAWRLERFRDTAPPRTANLIDALLRWRKAERIATTYGYPWLDEHVSAGRLRGEWSGSDGAAGRMTASAGLHNLPAPMRPAVAADPGHSFVRADLGQIEPRVLAAVSGDQALIAATVEDDLYRPVARTLGVDRDVAKVAVLGAMYGATTGESAGALRGLQRSYPVAMQLLESAAGDGKRGRDIFTVGGRRVRMGHGSSVDGDLDRAVVAAEARGRYARNALIQGAAAEFFKVWAVIVRRRLRPTGGRVVLCLHDELLVHVPAAGARDAAVVVAEALDEAAYYWSPRPDVRFVADIGVIDRWSEAKD